MDRLILSLRQMTWTRISWLNFLFIHPAFVGDNVVVAQKTTQKTTQNLTSNQQAILDYIQNNPEATRKDIADAISDISEDGVKYNLARLQDLGIIKRVGGRKQGYWEVILK